MLALTAERDSLARKLQAALSVANEPTAEYRIAELTAERDGLREDLHTYQLEIVPRLTAERDRLLNWLVIVAALKGVDDIFRLVDNYLEPDADNDPEYSI